MSNESIILQKTMDKILDCDIVNRHSYFQLKYFVVGKEPTLQSKMWRCIKELAARQESLKSIDLEIMDTKENIELIEIDIERLEKSTISIVSFEEQWEKDLHTKETSIRIRKKDRQKKALNTSLEILKKKKKETEEESNFFVQYFEALQRIEPLKPFDDLEEQTKYWNEKLTQLINLKVLLHNSLDVELIQTILSLGDDCAIKNEVVNLLDRQRIAISEKTDASNTLSIK